MKTLVLTGYDDGFAWLGDKTLASKEAWARRHGAAFDCVRKYEPGSHPSWQKLRVLEVALRTHDVVIWLDADSVVTNPDIPPAHFLPRAGCALTVSKDWSVYDPAHEYRHFSMGNFCLLGRPAGRRLIWLAGEKVEYRNGGLWEQGALHAVLTEMPSQRRLVDIRPRRELNAVPVECQPAAVEPWQPGDFLAHLTGADKSTRLKALKALSR